MPVRERSDGEASAAGCDGAAPARGRRLAPGALLVLLLGLAHLVRLDADPPPLLAPDFLSDEGWWAHNARQHLVFGRWVLDDHNPPLYGAPLWTVTLRAVYELVGAGLWQTRLPAALAGLASAGLLYAFVRRSAGAAAGLLAAALLGLDAFSLVHHRAAFVESFMVLWLVAAFTTLARADGRAPVAAAAGALFAAAVLAKVWAVGAGIVAAGFCLARALLGRPGRRREPLREALAFGAGGAAVAAAVAALFVLPHLDAVRAGLGVHSQAAAVSNPILSFGMLGLAVDPGGPAANGGLLRGSTALLLAAGLVLVRAIVVRPGWLREPPVLLCLVWIAGTALQVGANGYQPDRRWLALPPAAAALVALGWAQGGLALPTRAQWRAASRAQRVVALGLAALGIGLLVRVALVEPLAGAFAWPFDPYNTRAVAGGVAWALCAAGALLALAVVTRFALPARPLACPVAALLGLAFLAQAGATGLAIARAPHGVRDASRALASATRDWPPERRRMLGDPADTLALETELFAFVIRRWPWAGMYMNLDGWERFAPWIVVGAAPERPDYVPVALLPIARDAAGATRTVVPVWARADVAGELERALRPLSVPGLR